MAAMPVSGEAPMHSIAASLPCMQESRAITAKVGAAARHSQSAMPKEAVLSEGALPEWISLMVVIP